MEFEKTAYAENENAGQVLVCVVVTSRHSYCPVGYDFSLVLGNIPGSASKISILISVSYVNVSVLEGMGKTSFCLGVVAQCLVYWTSSHLSSSLTPNKRVCSFSLPPDLSTSSSFFHLCQLRMYLL